MTDESKLAWPLLVELRTRITTQELHLRAGVEQAALDSLVAFFKQTRQLMAQCPTSPKTSELMLTALNAHIRPFTARWHAHAQAGRLGSADQRYLFRNELRQLQLRLRGVADQLAVLAVPPEGEPPVTQPLSMKLPAAAAQATGRLAGGISGQPETGGVSASEAAQLNAAERAQVIKRRRENAESSPGEGGESTGAIHDLTGLAISGGGIRSSTFALGVVQQLARRGYLRQFDYLSTVSGGGYIGSFITAALSSNTAHAGLAPAQAPFGGPGDAESAAVRHLRNHSKYLVEGGIRSFAEILFLLTHGVLVTLLLVLPWVMLLAWVYLHWPLATQWRVAASWAMLALGVGFALAYTAGLRRLRTPRLSSSLGGSLLLMLGFLLLLLWLPAGRSMVAGEAWKWAVAAVLLIPALGLVRLRLKPQGALAAVVDGLLRATGPLLFVALFYVCSDVLGSSFAISTGPWVQLAAVIVLIAAGNFLVDLNAASPHGYYRSRLARTYLVAPGVSPQAPIASNSDLKLSATTDTGPIHLINAALNCPGSDDPALRGRGSVNFVFSRHHCGSSLSGWHSTAEWEKSDPNLDLGTAMAISGAAAAPNMGQLTDRRFTMLLAMLNIRLGYWLRQPGQWRRRPVSNYFLQELFGSMHHRQALLNVSDGGHFENLAVYELLRRRCRTIVAIDGECDPRHSFGGLLNLVRLAKIDFNIEIQLDLSDLRLDSSGHSAAHFITCRIMYPEGEGTLVYAKLSMTGNESEYLKAYRNQNPSFPHDSTAQQLYSEAQWEAYRALGDHVGAALFAPHFFASGQAPDELVAWADSLYQTLSR